MRKPVRAKFCLLSIERHHDDRVKVCFGAVTAGNHEGDSEENKAFWDATPTGDFDLWYTPDQECDLEVGKNYYVDVVPTDDDPSSYNNKGDVWAMSWVKRQRNCGPEYRFDLRYGSGPSKGELVFGLDSPERAAAKCLGYDPDEGGWNVVVTPAE